MLQEGFFIVLAAAIIEEFAPLGRPVAPAPGLPFRSHRKRVCPSKPPEAFIRSQFRIVLPTDQHLGDSQEIGLLGHAGNGKQSLKAGREGDETLALVKVEIPGSEYIPGKQQLALAAIPPRHRPISLEMDTEFFAPAVEGHAGKVPIGRARGGAWRDVEKRQQLFAVVEPCRGDDRATASLYRLLFVGIFRRDFEQQVSYPERPFGLTPASIGAVERHG